MILAIIVSDRLRYCDFFIKSYELNPKYFVTATCKEDLQGFSRDTPIIVTHHNYDLDRDFLECINMFKSVRFIKY